jgi:hypothetical protein
MIRLILNDRLGRLFWLVHSQFSVPFLRVYSLSYCAQKAYDNRKDHCQKAQ